MCMYKQWVHIHALVSQDMHDQEKIILERMVPQIKKKKIEHSMFVNKYMRTKQEIPLM